MSGGGRGRRHRLCLRLSKSLRRNDRNRGPYDDRDLADARVARNVGGMYICYMGSKPTIEEITIALQESGYLMELEVASMLEASGFVVRTNWPFEDPDEGKSREVDVHAFRLCTGEAGGLQVTAVVLCECKNNSSPYVVITRPRAAADARYTPMEFHFPREEFEKSIGEGRFAQVSTFRELGLHRIHYALSERVKGVQFCQVIRQGKRYRADHAGLYEALFLSLAKAVLALRQEHQHYMHTIGLFFPVVVLSGDLYTIDSSDRDPVPIPAQRVTFCRQLDSASVKGHFMCDFVTETALESFLRDELQPFVGAAVEKIMENQDLAFALDRH